MKKLLTLFTLLLTVCSGAWAEKVSFVGGTESGQINVSGNGSQELSSTPVTINIVSPGSKSQNRQIWKDGSTAKNEYAFQLSSGAGSDYNTKYVEISVASGYKITGVTLRAANGSGTTAGTVYGYCFEGAFSTETGAVKAVGSFAVPGNGGTSDGANVAMTGIVNNTRTVRIYKQVKYDSSTNTINGTDGSNYPSSTINANIASITVTYEAAAPAHTITLDKNGGDVDGEATATEGSATLTSITAPTRAGYSVEGYYDDNVYTNKIADASGNLQLNTTYTDEDGKWTSSSDEVTLYAKWEEIINDYSFTPATSGDAPSDGGEFNTSTGGTMTKVGGTITYEALGLYFQSTSNSVVNIELNNHSFKAGTIITGVLTNGGTTSAGRGGKIKTKTGSDVSKDGAIWTWDPAGTNEEKTFSYTVQTGDGIIGTNSFRLGRVGNFYLKSLTVTNAELVSVPVTIGDACYASFASTSALDFTDSGITAYIATANGTENVTMTEIAKVPANTGVVLKGTKGTVNVPVLNGDADDTTGNLLKPGAKTVTQTEADNDYIYAFGKKGGQVGFVKAHAGFTITAGKAYLDLSGTGGAKDVEFLSFVFGDEEQGETDGIKSVQGSGFTVNDEAYNLSGQRVGADYKGLVIINGKKVIRK